ncbi:sodium/solute symporter [Beijerinckia sp. L45]|uniref:sodium:solute symporter family transporter n=1 Tax=Beijerinckia sp. L45 TaxID=1641855 RepID=UPI00131E4A38|nr:sodium/solute symporter [Beijerinckia sp. L45]
MKTDPLAIALFLVFVGITLVITWRVAARSRTRASFYTAGGDITALQNGLAMAGDFLSAAAFLGITAVITTSGFDGILYALGFLMGWPVLLFLVAEPLRAIGSFSFADVLARRLSERPMRIMAACNSLVVIVFYLIAQMVGAGQLIELLFGLDYVYALVIVGCLMIIYVTFGGMAATTWVQIIKAGLFLAGAVLIAILTLAQFGFDPVALLTKAVAVHPKHQAILASSALRADPVSAFSLAIALTFGTAGLPHILMRFFTVADVRTARVSVLYTTAFIGSFFLLVMIIGYGAVALVLPDPAYHTAAGALRGGGNMAAIHLAHAVGGASMMGFISAVGFATILAVVSGLTLAGASAVSHDLYARAFRRTNERLEMRVSRIATVALGVLAVALGLVFRSQNVAYMVALAFAVAASANFPVLVLAIYWRGLTTAGAIAGGVTGLVSAVGLTVIGPAVWVKVLGHAAPLFPFDPPAIVTMPLAFAVAIGVSLVARARVAATPLPEPARSL